MEITVAISPMEGWDMTGNHTPCEERRSNKNEKSTNTEYEMFRERKSVDSPMVENAEDNRVVRIRGNQQYLPDIVKRIIQISPLNTYLDKYYGSYL
ncbi:hypothetical protein J6590_076687 [Homalodisca vitripennis]|nr:hypothetical protein J6590_076687 [Homalodisca vitripennis]